MKSDSFEVKDCPHGVGIYTRKPFHAGEVLFQFEGKRVKELKIIEPGDEGYYLQVSKDEYVDTIFPGRFTCHCCDPNAGLIDEITLVAIKEIPVNKEVVFDYSTCMLENSWTLNCHCGSSNCRGIIKDFDQLPKELQKYYLDLKIVPTWISEYIS